MKEIGPRDVETYVRTLISESLGLQTEGTMGKTEQRDEGAHAGPSSAPIQPETAQNCKKNEMGNY